MKFWKRQATLQIGSKRFGMDDLYFKFTVPFEDSEKLGTATIEAYNLSPATRNSIKKGMPIILNAGYEGDIGAIFTGKVSQVSDKHSGTEVITTIAAAEALEEWLSKEVNKTYTAGSKASAIVKDLLNIFGLEVGTMELAVDKEYPRGKVCKGKVKNVLTEIVTSDCKSRFLIRNARRTSCAAHSSYIVLFHCLRLAFRRIFSARSSLRGLDVRAVRRRPCACF